MNKILLFFFTLLISTCSIAYDTGSDLKNRLNFLKNTFLEFQQYNFNKEGKKTLDATGKIWIKDQTTFYIHVDTPNFIKFVSNGDAVWHLDSEEHLTTIQSFKDVKRDIPLIGMLNDPNFFKQKIKNYRKNSFNIELNSDFSPYTKVNLNINLNGKIKRVEFIDEQGNHMIFNFHSQNYWKVEQEKFNFKIPEVTGILDTRKKYYY